MPRAVAALLLVALVAACSGPASPTPVRPGSTAAAPTSVATGAGPTAPPPSAAAPTDTAAEPEPGVIKGRVTDEQGDPVAGAELRVVGYTGGSNLGQNIFTTTTGSDGTYRAEVEDGLYEVLGQTVVRWSGADYRFNLDAVDGACDQALSADGIVEDFELRLSGLQVCFDEIDPDDYLDYHGGAVQLYTDFTTEPSPDSVVVYVLTPLEPLADGSPGEVIEQSRTVAALGTSFGPIDETYSLYDIPLGRYGVRAQLIEPDGTVSDLLLSSDATPEPAPEAEITFGARQVLPGFTIPTLYVHDSAG